MRKSKRSRGLLLLLSELPLRKYNIGWSDGDRKGSFLSLDGEAINGAVRKVEEGRKERSLDLGQEIKRDL